MSSKRYRNLSKAETAAAARADARVRGCTCPRPSVHVIRPSRAGTSEGHVTVRHHPACPMVTAGTTWSAIVHPEVRP